MRNEIDKLSGMFSALSTLDKDMSIQQMQVLLMIANKPGMTQAEIGSVLDITTTNMNRWVGELEAKSAKRHPLTRLPLPGLGWVTKQEDPMHRSRKPLVLTAKGKQVLDNLFRYLWGDIHDETTTRHSTTR